MSTISDKTSINILNMVNDPNFNDILQVLYRGILPDEIKLICIDYFKKECTKGYNCEYSHKFRDALYTLKAYNNYYR